MDLVILAIPIGLGALLFISNIIVYSICKCVSYIHPSKCGLFVSLFTNILIFVPITAIINLATDSSMNSQIFAFISIPMSLVVILMINLPFHYNITTTLPDGEAVYGVGIIRDKMLKNYLSFNWLAPGFIKDHCEHCQHGKNIKSYLENSPPIIQVRCGFQAMIKYRNKHHWFNLFAFDYLPYQSWDKVECEDFDTSKLFYVKPKLEIQMDETCQTKLEEMKELMQNYFGNLPPPTEIRDTTFGTDVYCFKYGFRYGAVVGKNSYMYRFNNSCFGKFMRFIGVIFGFICMIDNAFLIGMKVVEPRVVVKISSQNDLKYKFYKGAHDDDKHEDADEDIKGQYLVRLGNIKNYDLNLQQGISPVPEILRFINDPYDRGLPYPGDSPDEGQQPPPV